jgi:molybdopterin synthase catalytic subunit
MSAIISVAVGEDDFCVDTKLRQLHLLNPTVGAVVNFVGYVRDTNRDKSVDVLELEYYPGMTEAAIVAIAEQACQRWDLLGINVYHRVGKLKPTDQIVFVAVASAHRGDAFTACEFIMDYLKTKAPFWKKELGEDGARWVEQRQSDLDAMSRWGS